MIIRTAIAVVILMASAVSVAAQEIPSVQPGGVATLVVTAAAEDSVRFVVAPADGVRVFAGREGWAQPVEGFVQIPLTFGLPADAPAGRHALGSIQFRGIDGRREDRDLFAEVAARRAAELAVDAAAVTASAGSLAEIPYLIRNQGNVADTFRITVVPPSSWEPESVREVIAGGGQSAGSVRVRVPVTARRGSEHVVRITMEGNGVGASHSARVIVVGEESSVGDLVAVPGSIFVGSSAGRGTSTPEVAVSAHGEVRPGTSLSLAVRHSDGFTPPPAFREELSGPRLQLAVEAPTWSARAGDVHNGSSLVSGVVARGRGLEASYDSGAFSTEIFAARPWSQVHGGEEGHLLNGAAEYRTAFGTVGLSAGSVARGGGPLVDYSHTGAALTYAYRRDGHDLEAEAGIVRVGEDSLATTGPAAEVRYTLSQGRVSLATRLRKVPGTTSRTASQGDEGFASGSVTLTDRLAVTASGHATASPLVTGAAHVSSRGGALGFRLDLPAGITSRVSANYRATEMVGSAIPPSRTRTVRVAADMPVAGVRLEGNAEIGSAVRTTERPYRQARFGARWSSRNEWAWLGLSHYDVGIGAPVTSLDLSGAGRVREAEIQGGLSTRLNAENRRRNTSVWSSVTARINEATRLTAGVEFRGSAPDAPWRLSLGVGRSFGLPLPLKRAPVLEGLVFEDLDGDGRRGPGEPVLKGLDMTLGGLRTTTGEDGTFRFYESVPGELRLDRSGLPIGLVVPAGLELPSQGRASIPLTRTAAIELRLFLDRDGDRVLGAAEEFAAGALVALRGRDGVTRDAMTDGSGRVRFDGLPPGAYTILIDRPGGRQGAPLEVEVMLHPGSSEELTVPVPLRSLEIRMRGGTPLDLSGAISPTAPTAPDGPDGPTAQVSEATR